jgi:DNA-binding NarL/FixJ family response regulator
MPTRASWTLPRRLHLQRDRRRGDGGSRILANPAIRVAVVDDHPALHAGLTAILSTDPEMHLVGTATGEDDMWPLLRRSRPDVLLLDLSDPVDEALHLCMSITSQAGGPAVVLYAPSNEGTTAVSAALAGAAGIVERASPAAKLLGTIRAVARTAQSIPPVSLALKRRAAEILDPADHAILAMRLAGEPASEIADTLGVPPRTVWDRLSAMIARLDSAGVPMPAGAHTPTLLSRA